jgi:hypothetical protein
MTPAINKCYRGTNNGLTCTGSTDCPGGSCAQFIGDIAISLNPLTTGTSTLSDASGLFCPGQTATQQGGFRTSLCRGGTNNGKPCTNVGSCGAGAIECRTGGPLSNYCVGGANDGLGCNVTGTECPLPGACTQGGTEVRLIRAIGNPTGALTIGVPKAIRLASAFCTPATIDATVNSNANLPGPGATVIVGTVTLLP